MTVTPGRIKFGTFYLTIEDLFSRESINSNKIQWHVSKAQHLIYEKKYLELELGFWFLGGKEMEK